MIDSVKIIIVDDEIIAREIMEVYISKTPELELCGSFGNGVEAIAYAKQHQVDLVLLDIHMPELDGFSVFDFLSKQSKVIFTTAHREYALKGFEVSALDYLLKPISFERFFKAIQKFIDLNLVKQDRGKQVAVSYLFVRADRKMQKIDLTDVLYIESFSDYLKIHTSNGQIVTRETIKHIESKLPDAMFLRCHRSYIVALDKIKAYTNEHIELERITIPISRSYKHEVVSFLGDL